MKIKLLTILTVILTLGFFLSSCRSDVDYPNGDPNQITEEKESKVDLYLNLKVNDRGVNTRADEYTFEVATKEWEKLRTLRVIIVRPDAQNIVEHNTLIYLSQAQTNAQSLRHVFPVLGAEMKRIFLIGNEQSLPEEIQRMLGSPYIVDYNKPEGEEETNPEEGEDTPSEDEDNTSPEYPVIKTGEPLSVNLMGLMLTLEDENKVYLNNDGKSDAEVLWVPMSEYFDIRVKAATTNPEENTVEAPMFITRALTKFSFTAEFTNREIEYTKKIKIKEIQISNLSNKEWLFPHNAIYSPGKDQEAQNEEREITFYTVPNDAEYGNYTFAPTNFGVSVEENNGDLNDSYEPSRYFLESAIADPNKEKEYVITVITDESVQEGDNLVEKEITYPSVVLPNLPRLPRNTHVKVHLRFSDQILICETEVVPYVEIDLDPEFGNFKTEDPSSPIISWPSHNYNEL